MTGFNTKVTTEIENLTQRCVDHSSMDVSLYGKYDVKRGLRDINGKGVLAGLTQISNVQAVKVIDSISSSAVTRRPTVCLIAWKMMVIVTATHAIVMIIPIN